MEGSGGRGRWRRSQRRVRDRAEPRARARDDVGDREEPPRPVRRRGRDLHDALAAPSETRLEDERRAQRSERHAERALRAGLAAPPPPQPPPPLSLRAAGPRLVGAAPGLRPPHAHSHHRRHHLCHRRDRPRDVDLGCSADASRSVARARRSRIRPGGASPLLDSHGANKLSGIFSAWCVRNSNPHTRVPTAVPWC